MKWLLQLLVLSCLGALGGLLIYSVVGEPSREVACNPAELGEWEVCWDTVENEWAGQVLWIDARSEAEYTKGHVKGALWVSEKDAAARLSESEMMQAIGMAGVEKRKVVVYCASEACGSSVYIADQIRKTGFHDEVYTLFGGWKSVRLD